MLRYATFAVGLAVLATVMGSRSALAAEKRPRELPPPATQKIDFVADVQPILASHCLICHGPDKQESKYRLDQKAVAFKGGELGEPPIVPGKSAESPLIRFVAGTDDNFVMPPKGSRVSAAQVGILRAWIDQGAEWPKEADGQMKLVTRHWSFQKVAEAAPPALSDSFIANPIDAFVLAKLREAGLTPSPPAERATLIRRLYFDVLGLPPTPEEIEQFVSSTDPQAYEKLVERVLASPRYGERWARHWLDVVRFAETNGFEMNNERPNAWPYRDYIVDSLNADKPYDQFILEQLAGDALGVDAATGFLVGGAWDQVKSPDPVLSAMQRSDELADITNTTGTTFLALTVGCARCHNHKFDPILQKDFYSLQAVFAGVQHGERALRKVGDENVSRVAEAKKRLTEIAAAVEKFPRRVDALKPAANSKENEERFAPVTAKFVRFTCQATNNGSEPCLDEWEVFSVAAGGEQAKNVALASSGTKATTSGTYANDPNHKLEHINDGKFGNGRSWISNTAGAGWIQLEFNAPATFNRMTWGRDREERYKDRTAVRYVIEASADGKKWETIASSAQRKPFDGAADATEADAALLSQLTPADAAAAKPLLAERQQLTQELSVLEKGQQVYAGRFQQPGAMHRLYRGDPLQPREEVAPDCLNVIATLGLDVKAPEQQRRLALAKWIASPENPLTARVMVNRLWQHHFGTGLVDTPSDFGASGGKPTHPELLDWLARQLPANGWSLKHMHELMLRSNTYRQAGQPRPDALAKDAQCRLLWRFPPRRLEAEAIRDSILAVSGKLDLTAGGPGWSPFKPNSNYVRFYDPKDEFGPAEWRRAIYMTKIRMRQDGVFGTFDCPDAGQTQPKRARSTTALQALSLFNSTFILQQAQFTAQRLEKDVGDDRDAQVRRAYLLAFGRAPEADEVKASSEFVRVQGLPALCRALFNANEFLFVP